MWYKVKKAYIWVWNLSSLSWFHIPTSTEWNTLYNAGITDWAWVSNDGSSVSQYLKLPMAWYRNWESTNTLRQWERWEYWSCKVYSYPYMYCFRVEPSVVYSPSDSACSYWFTIRPFANIPVTPDSSWTALYSDKIYHNPGLWLISVKNWTWWITIADKNLWATTVWNNGDTLSESNCGKYYQWWNNYGFPRTWTISTTSSTHVDTTGYWNSNPYSSSTWVTAFSWISPNNADLWWWDTWPLQEKQIYHATEQHRTPWANTILYAPLDSTNQAKDLVSNTDMTTYWTIRYWTYWGCDCCDLTSYWGFWKNLWTALWVYTIIVWCNDINWYYSWSWKSWIIRWVGTHSLWISYNSSWYYAWWNSNTYLNISTRNKWYMFVYQTNGTQATNKVWVYDGSTLTNTTNIDNYTNMSMMYIWNADGNAQWFPWYISNVIIENKYWTQDEIESFIEWKKSYYWY